MTNSMDNERIKELDLDVADAKKALEQAEQEIKDAKAWHSKMILAYADAVLRRYKND